MDRSRSPRRKVATATHRASDLSLASSHMDTLNDGRDDFAAALRDIEPKIQLSIKRFDGTETVVEARKSDTVGALKSAIEEQLGVAPIWQKLVHNRNALTDSDAELDALNVTEGTSLILLVEKPQTPPTFEVFVKTLIGKTIPVHVNENTTVLQMKEQLQDTEGFPPEQQRLIFAGQQLENDRRLVDSRIREGSYVHLVLRLRKG